MDKTKGKPKKRGRTKVILVFLCIALGCLVVLVLIQARITHLEADIIHITPAVMSQPGMDQKKLNQMIERSTSAQRALQGRHGYYRVRRNTALYGGAALLISAFSGVELLRKKIGK